MTTPLLRNNIAMQDGDTLLDYSIRPAPIPAVIGKVALPESPVDLVFGTGSIMQLYVLGLSGTIYVLEATG